MKGKTFRAALAASVFVSASSSAPARALGEAQDQSTKIADLQRQVDELKAMVHALQAAPGRSAPVAAAPAAGTAPAPASSAPASAAASPPHQLAAAAPPQSGAPAAKKAWYEKLQLRGYTQLRVNEILSGPKTAPAGLSRLRAVQDGGVNENGNFSIRRARLVVQGDISNRVSLYLQGDLAAAVSNQSGTERRENFMQLRDAYADVFLDKAKTLKLRLGQSKVPFGWENLQSSSNRIPLDRSDAINAPVPGERDLGIVAYYTPPKIQAIWDELSRQGQKLFGNYGALGVGIFNGQGVNRTERSGGVMTVAMATMPIRLDGLGGPFEGQVAEFGGSLMRNRFRPELRSGGVSAEAHDDSHVALHALLYPHPFGVQTEWTWGRSPEWDPATSSIRSKDSFGGYVMAMYRVPESPIGQIIPFARWQHYRGGWKAAVNAPRLETNEIEFGVEWLPIKELELTLAYSRVDRTEADERRIGRAQGDLVRAQVQWNY